jgi:hypothetical protein
VARSSDVARRRGAVDKGEEAGTKANTKMRVSDFIKTFDSEINNKNPVYFFKVTHMHHTLSQMHHTLYTPYSVYTMHTPYTTHHTLFTIHHTLFTIHLTRHPVYFLQVVVYGVWRMAYGVCAY